MRSPKREAKKDPKMNKFLLKFAREKIFRARVLFSFFCLKLRDYDRFKKDFKTIARYCIRVLPQRTP